MIENQMTDHCIAGEQMLGEQMLGEQTRGKNERIRPGWNFDNSYARLPENFYSIQAPTPVRSPELVMFNKPLADSLGLNSEAMQSGEGLEALSGNRMPETALPLAQAYAGHQFGHFTMLGDGRAVLIGEQLTPDGKRFDIQLKGSGRTPYSRGGDGRAALGPMLREYLISEAMFALGIPTTRSLAVIKTGQPVMRERMLPGAILTRVATSHIRVGTFQCFSRWGSVEELKALADYTLQRHFPEAIHDEQPYLLMLKEVIRRQAALIAQWQLIGFIHGVMNTDNMTVSGETIDYGPCAFMDSYDPDTVFSSIDTHGRYAYGNQPKIAAWNLARFAETLLPLLHESKAEAARMAETLLADFPKQFNGHWLEGMRRKLGLYNEEPGDEELAKQLLQLMQEQKVDYTNTFIALTFDQIRNEPLFNSEGFKPWYNQWNERLNRQNQTKEEVQQLMKRSNPALIPRNHRVEEALEAAVEEDDYRVLKKFLKALADPYAHRPEQSEYATLPEPTFCRYQTFCGT